MNPGADRGSALVPVSEIDASCRLPLLVVFISAAIWLLLSSVLGLLASVSFHAPDLFSEHAWLTYGRVRPAANNAFLYGFCVQAGLGVAVWLLARLGRTLLVQPVLITVGAKLWNLGLTIGVLAILAGDSTGYETLEMPRYAALLLFLGYLLMAIWAVLTFHRRQLGTLYVAQWFLVAALFWFPWIFSAATLLLTTFPVRGVAQAVIGWWYANNLQFVFLWLVGLGTAFYYFPKGTNRPLHSQYLALVTFWMLLLFGSWGGIPTGAPVPVWLPASSTAATVLLLVPIAAAIFNLNRTVAGECGPLKAVPGSEFLMAALPCFLLSGFAHVLSALNQAAPFTTLTWFNPAVTFLNNYGFFTFTMFAAIYLILPRLLGLEFHPTHIKAHFGLAVVGLLLFVVPLAIGGLIQGAQLQDARQPFLAIVRQSLVFVRISTLGELLLLVSNLLFLTNVLGLVGRFSKARATATYTALTTELKPAEARL